ncbi:MAG: hypothetical protein AAF533_09590 [Acidobacteriota bacterium]
MPTAPHRPVLAFSSRTSRCEHRKTTGRLWGRTASLLLATAFVSPATLGCQRPLSTTGCHVVPEAPTAPRGAPVRVTVTLDNVPAPGEPILNDVVFVVALEASTLPIDGGCFVTEWEPALVDPPEQEIVLDDPRDPFADDPSSWTLTYTIDPLVLDQGVFASFRAEATTAGGVPIARRQCFGSTCIATPELTSSETTPTARFEDELVTGEAGATLPLTLHVDRNGHDPTRSLTVRVTPQNPDDPDALFPIEPAELTTIGLRLEPGEDTVRFESTLPLPCFAGSTNGYHVTLTDDADVELFNSRTTQWGGLGLARVQDAALTRRDVLEAGRASETPTTCEDVTVRTRLVARNPYLDVSLDDLRLHLPLPDGLELLSSDFRFVDNPLDAIDPDPGLLLAGVIVEEVRRGVDFRLDTLLDRHALFEPPAPIFRDVLLLDLELTTSNPDVIIDGALVLPELTLEAMADGELVTATSPAVIVPIAPGSAPTEVSSPDTTAPLLWESLTELTWEEATLSGSSRFDVLRGELFGLRERVPTPCLVSGLPEASHSDGEIPESGFYYLVRGTGCGATGPAGRDSQGIDRLAGSCP